MAAWSTARGGAVDDATGGAVDGGAVGGAVDGATGAVGGVGGAAAVRSAGATARAVRSAVRRRRRRRVAAPRAASARSCNGGSLLDANVNIHANANLAAPVNGAVAANANVAAPIDAAVAANIGSDGAVAQALGDQEVNIHQSLDDVAADATAAAGRHRRPAVAASGPGVILERDRQTGPPPIARRASGRLRSRGSRAWSCSATVSGSGYKEGAALVRRADGQMVQLGPLMYGLLEEIDGERDHDGARRRDVGAARPPARRPSTSPRSARSSPSRACWPARRRTRRRG